MRSFSDERMINTRGLSIQRKVDCATFESATEKPKRVLKLKLNASEKLSFKTHSVVRNY